MRNKFRILILTLILIGLLGGNIYAETLHIGYHRQPDNLHPGFSTSLPDIMVNMFVYDALVVHDNDGELRPLLAKSWEKSEDGTVWTIHLNKGVFFHSGNEFTAHDVKAHFDNWQKSPTKAKITSLDRTEVVDDYTVKCYLKYPTLEFMNMISQIEWGYCSIPEAEAVEKWGDDYGVVPDSISGTGPFKVTEWVRGDRIVLERFDKYTWGPDMYENTGPAHLEKIVIHTMPEAYTRTAALETGEIDVDISLSPQIADMVESINGVSVFKGDKATVNNFGFNLNKEISQDKNVRFAVAHAINQQEIIDGAWNGFATEHIGFFHQNYGESTPRDEIMKYHRGYDPEKSMKLLDESGWVLGNDGWRYKNGEQLALDLYVYTGIQEDIAIVIKDQLKKVGINIGIQAMEYAAAQEAFNNGVHDLRYLAGDFTASGVYWFTSASIPNPNYLRLSSETYDTLYEISQSTTDPQMRIEAYQGMEKLLIVNQYIVPMPHHLWLIGYRDSVELGQIHPIQGIFKLLDARINN